MLGVSVGLEVGRSSVEFCPSEGTWLGAIVGIISGSNNTFDGASLGDLKGTLVGPFLGRSDVVGTKEGVAVGLLLFDLDLDLLLLGALVGQYDGISLGWSEGVAEGKSLWLFDG